MNADRDARIAEAVEEIARNDERAHGRRSPFHLNACGGCGAPAFQQPCSLCGYYPMGSDKGTWHPREATPELFEKMIERSGPGGKDGTIATWHAREGSSYLRSGNEAIVSAAARTSVPSAREIWQAVAAEGRSFYRGTPPLHVHYGWSGLREAAVLVRGDIGPGAPSLSGRMAAVMDAWTAAVHAEDRDGMSAAVEQGLGLCREIEAVAGSSGNLSYAIKTLDQALDAMATGAAPSR